MEWTDEDRQVFLKALDNEPDILVSDWEASFLDNNLQRNSFSDAQRKVVDGMIKKYGDRFKW